MQGSRTWARWTLLASSLTLLVAALLLPPRPAQAQPAELEKQVATALLRGDAEALTALCADRVDVALGGTSTTYSRAQVRYVLAEFLRTNPPTAFAFEDRMAGGDAELVSGRYVTDGKTYYVMARFGRRGDAWEVRELRIDG